MPICMRTFSDNPIKYVDKYLEGLPDSIKSKIKSYPLVCKDEHRYGIRTSDSESLVGLPRLELGDGQLALIAINASAHYVAMACFRKADRIQIYYHDSGSCEISVIGDFFTKIKIGDLIAQLFPRVTPEISFRNDFSQADEGSCGFCAAKFLIYATEKFKEQSRLEALEPVPVNPFRTMDALTRLSLIELLAPRERIIASPESVETVHAGHMYKYMKESIYSAAIKELRSLISETHPAYRRLEELNRAILEQEPRVLRYSHLNNMIKRAIGYPSYKEILDKHPTAASFIADKVDEEGEVSLSGINVEVCELLELEATILPQQAVITNKLLALQASLIGVCTAAPEPAAAASRPRLR